MGVYICRKHAFLRSPAAIAISLPSFADQAHPSELCKWECRHVAVKYSIESTSQPFLLCSNSDILSLHALKLRSESSTSCSLFRGADRQSTLLAICSRGTSSLTLPLAYMALTSICLQFA